MTNRSGSGSGTTSGSSATGQDPALKNCTPVERNKNDTICNYCGLLIKSECITRFKFHLLHTNPHSNTKKCPRVFSDIKEEIQEILHKKTKAKAKKTIDIEEIRVELCGTMGDNQRYVIDEDNDDNDDDDDDDDDDDNDVYMYLTDMLPNEQDAYKVAVRVPKAIEWDQQQHVNICGKQA